MQWKLESLKEDLDLSWLHRKFDPEMEKPNLQHRTGHLSTQATT